MSKRHKHRFSCQQEKRCDYIELQRLFVILILIILIYSDKHKHINYKIICSTKKKNSTAYSGSGTAFSDISEPDDKPISIKISNKDNERENFICNTDNVTDIQENNQAVENYNTICDTKKKNSPLIAEDSLIFSEETEAQVVPVSVQMCDEGNFKVNFTCDIDSSVPVQRNVHKVEENNNYKNNNILESMNSLQAEPVILYSNITVLNIETVTSSPMDDLNQHEGEVGISVPVLLSNINMEAFVEALTKFPEQVFKIKDMDKKVIIKDCRLIPGTNKLFIEGLIVENVEYANEGSVEKDSMNGIVKKVIFNIPFKASEVVTFLTKPSNLEQYSDVEVEFLNADGYDADINEKNPISQEFLNKFIFGEINIIEILETDTHEEIKPLQSGCCDMHTFEKVRKKIVVKIGLNLLQNQEIFVGNSTLNNIKETY